MLYLVLAVLLWGLVHSVLASLRVKTWVRQHLGPGPARYYRLAYNLFSALTFLPVLYLLRILPDRFLYAIPMPWLILTGVGQLLGVIILVVGLLQTDALDFIGLRALWDPSPQPARLTTDGLYRYMRHPLYTGGLLVLWLIPWMTVNLLVLVVSLTLYLLIGAFFEERKLLREFGPAYAAYRARTPMLIPRLPHTDH